MADIAPDKHASILKLYLYSKTSFRKISKKTGIMLTSIYTVESLGSEKPQGRSVPNGSKSVAEKRRPKQKMLLAFLK